jgi:acyl-CoA synthetase (AMP-forming)/AMP-acid ligase II
MLPEIAVFSGDTVRKDAEGFLYFIGRRDEMIKTSGYRVSPTEVEEILYATRLVGECVAFGVDHPTLGQAIRVIATRAGRQRRGGRGSAARPVPGAHAGLHAAGRRRRRGRPAAAQPERQDRPQAAGHTVGRASWLTR